MLHKTLRVRILHSFLCFMGFCMKILRAEVFWFCKSGMKQAHKLLSQLIFNDMLNPVLVHSAVPALTEKDYGWVAPACWVHAAEYNNNIHSYPNEFHLYSVLIPRTYKIITYTLLPFNLCKILWKVCNRNMQIWQAIQWHHWVKTSKLT